MTQDPLQSILSVHVREHEPSPAFSNTRSLLPVKLDAFACLFKYMEKRARSILLNELIPGI